MANDVQGQSQSTLYFQRSCWKLTGIHSLKRSLMNCSFSLPDKHLKFWKILVVFSFCILPLYHLHHHQTLPPGARAQQVAEGQVVCNWWVMPVARVGAGRNENEEWGDPSRIICRRSFTNNLGIQESVYGVWAKQGMKEAKTFSFQFHILVVI